MWPCHPFFTSFGEHQNYHLLAYAKHVKCNYFFPIDSAVVFAKPAHFSIIILQTSLKHFVTSLSMDFFLLKKLPGLAPIRKKAVKHVHLILSFGQNFGFSFSFHFRPLRTNVNLFKRAKANLFKKKSSFDFNQNCAEVYLWTYFLGNGHNSILMSCSPSSLTSDNSGPSALPSPGARASLGCGMCGQSHCSQVHSRAGAAWQPDSASWQQQLLLDAAASIIAIAGPGSTAQAPQPIWPIPSTGQSRQAGGQGPHEDQSRTREKGALRGRMG